MNTRVVQMVLPITQTELKSGDRVELMLARPDRPSLPPTGRIVHTIDSDYYLVSFRGGKLETFNRNELLLISRKTYR